MVLWLAILGIRGTAQAAAQDWKRGVAYTSWWSNDYLTSASDQSLAQARGTGAEWITLLATDYMSTKTSNTISPTSKTPTPAAIEHAIDRAHQVGLKVLLKPHVDVNDGTWRGAIQPSSPSAWFASYSQFIDKYADLARNYGADEIAVGTELESMSGYEPEWRQVVAGVRARFNGPVTYAANFSEFAGVDWWDAVDYIGIDGYFPLGSDASVAALVAAWQPWVAQINAVRSEFGKTVVFTEIGYQSLQGSTATPWWTTGSPVDQGVQRNAYEAAFQTWSMISWFRGFFWWDWSFQPGAPGQGPGGFSPQGKLAQSVLTAWHPQQLPNPGATDGPTPDDINGAGSSAASSAVPGLTLELHGTKLRCAGERCRLRARGGRSLKALGSSQSEDPTGKVWLYLRTPTGLRRIEPSLKHLGGGSADYKTTFKANRPGKWRVIAVMRRGGDHVAACSRAMKLRVTMPGRHAGAQPSSASSASQDWAELLGSCPD